jgi:hypothetical protein
MSTPPAEVSAVLAAFALLFSEPTLAARVWALPFLTALCPSERYAPCAQRGRHHMPLPERARGCWAKCAAGCPTGRSSWWLIAVVVADRSYATLELLA